MWDGASGRPQRVARINTWSRPNVLALGVGLLLAFLICIIVGATGPNVISILETDPTTETLTSSDEVGFDSFEFDVVPRNQLLWVETRLSRPPGLPMDAGERAQTELVLDVVGGDPRDVDVREDIVAQEEIVREVVCEPQQDFCNWFDLWNQDFIYYESYRVSVVFTEPLLESGESAIEAGGSVDVSIQHRLMYVDADYTAFEIGWKYTFLIITLVALLIPRWGYAWQMCQTRSPSFEQRFTLALLWLLVFFNDPFFAASANKGGNTAAALTAWYILVVAAFFFTLLLFWLCLFHDTRIKGLSRGAEPERTACYWLPKVTLVLLISLTILGIYFSYRYGRSGSNTYSPIDDSPGTVRGALIFTAILVTVYFLWVIVMALGTCGTLGGLGPGVHFLYASSLVTLFLFIIGLFASSFYPVASSSIVFLGFFAVLNLYIWSLALALGPVAVDDGVEEVNLNWDGASTGDINMVRHHRLPENGGGRDYSPAGASHSRKDSSGSYRSHGRVGNFEV